MDIYISLIVIILGCLLLYYVCEYVFVLKKDKKQIDEAHKFKIDVYTNKYIKDYVDRMPKQYKDNSRILEGSGKTHFAEAVAEGSTLVKNETISVLASMGDRFS